MTSNGETVRGPSGRRLSATMLVTFSLVAAVLAPVVVARTARPGPTPAVGSTVGAKSAAEKDARNAYAKLPLRFELNRGQTDPQVKFVARGSRHSLFLTPSEAVLSFLGDTKDGRPATTQAVRMELVAANKKSSVVGEELLPGTSNYFMGNDPKRWAREVPGFAKVRYRDVYPGTDLLYYSDSKGRLEYDLILDPGADPSAIALRFNGHRGVAVDANGDLVVSTADGEMRQHKPVAYQQDSRGRRAVSSRYVVDAESGVRFELGNYDRRRPLVIDPVLTYSTYLGGSGMDEAVGVATDAAGNAYVTGSTISFDFPMSRNADYDKGCGVDGKCDPTPTSAAPDAPTVTRSDVFVTKIDTTREGQEGLVYSTYLGGSGEDAGAGIAVDGQGRAYVTGRTDSTGFPTVRALDDKCGSDAGGTCNVTAGGETRPDAFVARLDQNGSALEYSTYLGGKGDDARAGGTSYEEVGLGEPGDIGPASKNGSSHPGLAGGIAVDGTGHAYVTGSTMSSDFPTTGNAYDASCGSDGLCDKVVSKETACSGQCVRLQPDAFVTKLDTTRAGAASLVYSTFLGGSGADAGYGMAVATDPSKPLQVNAYLTGSTSSTARPAPPAVVLPPPNPLIDPPTRQAFPTSLNAYARDMPIEKVPNAAFTSPDDEKKYSAVFLTRIDTAVSTPDRLTALLYSTYLAGPQTYEHVPGALPPRQTGSGVAADSSGRAYVGGQTASAGFPTRGPLGADGGRLAPYQQSRAGSGGSNSPITDAFFTKIDTTKVGEPSLDYSTYLGGSGDDSARGVALDPSGNVFVSGRAVTDFPRKGTQYGGPLRAAFVAQIDAMAPGEAGLIYSTLLGGDRFFPGGSGGTYGNGIAAWTDSSLQTHLHVVGSTGNNDLSLVGSLQGENAGADDGFLARFSPTLPSTPYVAAVAPSSGVSSGGTPVTITGSGFSPSSRVTFGGSLASEVTVVDSSKITVKSPPGDGSVDVRVSTADGTSFRSSFSGFTYFDGSWEDVAGSPVARYGHTATALPSGKVLIIGGTKQLPNTVGASAALFDPTLARPGSDPWVAVGTAGTTFGVGHSATLLDGPHCGANCGKVLVIFKTSAKLFNPDGTWEDAGIPVLSREFHTATLLRNGNCGQNCGKVFVVGGVGGVATDSVNRPAMNAELYDPAKNSWSRSGPPVDERVLFHTATLITGPGCELPVPYPDCGKVLVVGGASSASGNAASSASAELYDPLAVPPSPPGAPALPQPPGAFTAKRAVVSRYGHTATVLSTGKILIAGGAVALGGNSLVTPGRATDVVELYDPAKPFLCPTGPDTCPDPVTVVGGLRAARSGHTAVALPDGRALVVGGAGASTKPDSSGFRFPLASTEIFDPNLVAGRGGWREGAPMSKARGFGFNHGGYTTTLLEGPGCQGICGNVLVFGGTTKDYTGLNHIVDPSRSDFGPLPLADPELYTPGPFIAGITPTTGPAAGGNPDSPDDAVLISGSGFHADRMTDATSVRFGEAAARSFQVLSPTQIKAVPPAASGDDVVNVSVNVSGLGLATAPVPFTYAGLPGRVTDLVAEAVSGTEASLAFSAPGTVGNAGDPAAEYVIKQSRTPIDEGNFDLATSLCDSGICRFTPTRRGLPLTLSVKGLTPETTYYYALRARNAAGQSGPMSNVDEVLTGTLAPAGVTDLAATSVGEGKVELTFSAPGSNGIDPPPASRYVVKQSLDPISDEGFDAAPALCGGGICTFAPAAVGERLSISVDNLAKDTTYHYRLQALDAAGNAGPLSNAASATPGCVAVNAGANQLAYQAGYSLVGLPEGTVVPAQSSLYGWFDLGKGGRYSTQDPSQAVLGGRAYWAWFSCPRVVTLAGGVSSTRSSLSAFRASMVGNPSASRPATVTGHDFTARWDQSLNSGAGGYRISAYQQPQLLGVGEGIWAFSYRDTAIAVEAR